MEGKWNRVRKEIKSIYPLAKLLVVITISRLNCTPLEFIRWRPTSSILEYDFIWRWGLLRGDYVKMKPLGQTLNNVNITQRDCCPFKRRKRHEECMCTKERPCEEARRRRPPASQGEASGDTKPAGTLILDAQLPELRGNKILLFYKPPSLGYCVMVALVNWYISIITNSDHSLENFKITNVKFTIARLCLSENLPLSLGTYAVL